MMIFLRGGEEVTGATLTRFFGFHVAILPGLATLLILVHLLLVQRLGMSVPPKLEAEWKARSGTKTRNEVLSEFHAARTDGLVRRVGRSRRARGNVSVEFRRQSRSIRIGASRNQARVVLPLYVSDAQADSAQGLVH